MKVTTTNYGVQVKFTKEDPNVHYDGTFVSNQHIVFKPTKIVQAVFSKRKLRANYKTHILFTVNNHVCVSEKCQYNLYDLLSAKKTACTQEIIATGWAGVSKTGIPTSIYHNRATNEFVQINMMYATIIEALKNDAGRIMMENASGNMILVYQQDELIGGTMLLPFKLGGSRRKIEDI